jgi:hypothetical protein
MADLAERLFNDIKNSLGNAPREIGAELKGMGAHGAHELAAALFNGSAFVMYPRGKHDDSVHGPQVEAPQTPEVARDGEERSMSRGR